MNDVPKQNEAGKRVALSYSGTSAVVTDNETHAQSVLICTPEQTNTVNASFELKDPVAFREGMITFCQAISKSYNYKASSSDTSVRYNEWRGALKDATAGNARRLFYEFLMKEDPEAESILDPLVSVSPDGIAFESFSEDGRMYIAFELSKDAYQTQHTASGTCYADLSSDFVRGLSLLRKADAGTSLVIGESKLLPSGYQAEIKKSLNVGDEWLRGAMQLQATLTFPTRKFSLSRMDLYNVLRQLRLNKTHRDDKKAIQFTLVPNHYPEILLEPWEWQHQCTGSLYQERQSQVFRFWDRKDLLVLDRLLPFTESVDVYTCGEAEPTFFVLRCGDMSFTLGFVGFRKKNWPMGMLLDMNLPRQKESTPSVEKVLDTLPKDGSFSTAETISQKTSLDDVEVLQAFRLLSQDGVGIVDPAGKGFRYRPIDEAAKRREHLLYRNDREKRAYQLVEAAVITPESKWLRTGDVEVTARIEDDAFNNAVYEPFFVIRADGNLRRPRCTCSFSRDTANKGQACEHIRALWLKYQTNQRNKDQNRLEVDKRTLIRRKRQIDEIRELSLKHQRLEETWFGEKEKRNVLVFSSVDAARDAYLKRVKCLKGFGFMDVRNR